MENKRVILPGDYIAGFVDGEGCFSLQRIKEVKRKRKTNPVYYHWKAQFAIVVKIDDFSLLIDIRHTLGCGKVYINNQREFARFSVQNLDVLYRSITPFFRK